MTSPDESQPGPANPTAGISEAERLGFYIDMWKKSVDVQQHFNDIEWRIRGLALTAVTFALGAAGVAARTGAQFGHVSLAAGVVLVGLILWNAFYFVDRVWYHQLLKAAVSGGTKMEEEIKRSLPEAGMTAAISDGSGYKPGSFAKRFVKTNNEGYMRSDDKLVTFYRIGSVTLLAVAVGLECWTLSGAAITPQTPASDPKSSTVTVVPEFPQQGHRIGPRRPGTTASPAASTVHRSS